MRAHEAGALHAEGYRGPAWLQTPVDVNALVPSLWATSVGRGSDGVLTVGGVSVTELAREFGTPAYVIDEDDFRSRARDFKQTYAEVFDGLSGGADVFYAGKAFLCTEVARWVHDEGLHLDVCTGGELAVAKRAGVPGDRIGLHGNNKSVAEIRDALDYGVSRIVIDSFDEIERVAAVADRARGRRAGPHPRHGRGRGPHARVHRDGARGPEVRSVAVRRSRLRGGAPHPRQARVAAPARPAQPHRLADLRHRRLRGVGPAHRRPAHPDRARARRRAARARPRRRLRHRLHDRARPAAAEEPRGRHGRDHRARVPRRRGRRAAHLRSSPVAPSPAPPPSRSTRSAPSSRSTSTGAPSASTSPSTAA